MLRLIKGRKIGEAFIFKFGCNSREGKEIVANAAFIIIIFRAFFD